MKFRTLVQTLLVCAAATLGAVASAQSYPSKPVKILVGYSPGGGADAMARVYAAKLQEVLGTPVVVENRPGASELLAGQALMAAPADGYTVWLAGAALTMVPGIRDNLPYDPSKSFAHIGRVAAMHGVFSARNGLPVRSLPEMISYATANPGKLSYGSGGIGAPAHLIFELVKMAAGIDITHIPYKGDADVMRDLVGGGVDLGLVALSVGSPFVTEGKVQALAVTGANRAKGLPNTPALGETKIKALEGIDVFVSFGLVAPQATPPAIVQKLTDAVNRVSKMPDVVQRLEQLYMAPLPASPAEFQQHIAAEVTRWRNVNKRLKIEF